MKKMIVSVAMLGALANAWASDWVVKDGNCQWRFAEVNGTSRLPLDFMLSGGPETNLTSVTLPRYWIAEKTVTEAEFAAVMGREAVDAENGERPVRKIEWEEAHRFCRRFAEKYRAQIPADCLVSMPTMIEWAHAVRVLEKRCDLGGEVGTFLFSGSFEGGYLHTLWRGAEPLADALTRNGQLAWNLAVIPKRVRNDRVGLRMVIVDMTREMLGNHPLVARARVALGHGQFSEGLWYLERAKARGRLSSEQLEEVESASAFARAKHDEAAEDWSGLVALSARCAAKDYVTEPFCSRWQFAGWEDGCDRETARIYAQYRITGTFEKIGMLPRAVQKDQMLGHEHTVITKKDNITFTITTNTLVQVLRCDFTGDGREDRVVELFGERGAQGYCYNFYQQLSDGAYANVYELQTVGLCVLPRKDGRGCGFLAVDKRSNPILATRLLYFDAGKMKSRAAHDKPFYMLDAQEERIYRAAPFIGGGTGLGWRIVEAQGVWYRPLFWPWTPGRIQVK